MDPLEGFVAAMGFASMVLLAHKRKIGLWAYIIGQVPWFYICVTSGLPFMAMLSFVNSCACAQGLFVWDKEHV